MPGQSLPPTIDSWFAAHERARDVVQNLGVALLAWSLGELVLLPVLSGRVVTPIWPPVGLAVAVAYLGGFRLLPGIVLGSLAVNYGTQSLPAVLLLALSQVIQPVLVVRILRALKFDPRLERVRDPVILSLVAAPIGALAAAPFVAASSFAAGLAAQSGLVYDL